MGAVPSPSAPMGQTAPHRGAKGTVRLITICIYKNSQEPKLLGIILLFRNHTNRQAISLTVMETSGMASMELLTTISPDLIMSFTAV